MIYSEESEKLELMDEPDVLCYALDLVKRCVWLERDLLIVTEERDKILKRYGKMLMDKDKGPL